MNSHIRQVTTFLDEHITPSHIDSGALDRAKNISNQQRDKQGDSGSRILHIKKITTSAHLIIDLVDENILIKGSSSHYFWSEPQFKSRLCIIRIGYRLVKCQMYKKQARKLGICDSCLRNLKLWPTDWLSHLRTCLFGHCQKIFKPHIP